MYEACWDILALYSLKLRDKVDWHWPFCGDRQTVRAFKLMMKNSRWNMKRPCFIFRHCNWINQLHGRSHTSPHIIHNAMQLPLAVVLILILILPCRERSSISDDVDLLHTSEEFYETKIVETNNIKKYQLIRPKRVAPHRVLFVVWYLFIVGS